MSDDPNDTLTAATCPVCGNRARIVNPRGGDGTARVFVRHGRNDAWVTRPPCPGSRQMVDLDD